MGRSVPHNLKSTHQTEFVKIFNSPLRPIWTLGNLARFHNTRRNRDLKYR